MRILLIFLLSSCFYLSHSQKRQAIYAAISSDSSYRGHLLELKSKSIVEISTYPRHMSKQFKMNFEYKVNKGAITILKKSLNKSDSLGLINNGLSQYLDEVTINVDKKALIDQRSKIVFVRYKDFSKFIYITYVIDGKIFRQKQGQPDSYGLIKSSYKKNKKLHKHLDSIRNHSDLYDLRVVRGLDAYEEHGYKSAYGVYEFTKKK